MGAGCSSESAATPGKVCGQASHRSSASRPARRPPDSFATSLTSATCSCLQAPEAQTVKQQAEPAAAKPEPVDSAVEGDAPAQGETPAAEAPAPAARAESLAYHTEDDEPPEAEDKRDPEARQESLKRAFEALDKDKSGCVRPDSAESLSHTVHRRLCAINVTLLTHPRCCCRTVDFKELKQYLFKTVRPL
jgi:hypothetical protein